MASASLRAFRGGWGVFGRARRGGARAGGGARVVEGLEARTLMAVQLVSAPADAAPTNAPGNATGDLPEISEDGRWVVFASEATNLVAGVNDTNTNPDVFLRDLQTGTTTIISATGGTARGGQFPSVSADGRYVAFNTTSNAFAPAGTTDTNGSNDVYVFDRTAGTYTLASAVNGGFTAGGNSLRASISANGRLVAFVSTELASDFVAGTTDANGALRDVLVRNLDTNVTTVASTTPVGTTTGNARSDDPEISSDGNFVVFHSRASDLTPIADTNTVDDVFRRAVGTTAVDLVSVGSGPVAAGGASPSVNADGNLVAFESAATNLVGGDTNNVADVFVRDMTAGAFALASTNAAGQQANSNALNPSISANGQAVVFQSAASNLVAGAADFTHVYLKNRADGTVTRVSQNDAGEQAQGNSSVGSVDANGDAVAFVSVATNLAQTIEPQPETDEDVYAWTTGVPGPIDTTPPQAAINAPAVTAAGGTSHNITVTYTDDTAVDVASIDVADLTVTAPTSATPLAVTSVAVTPNTNAASVTATYTVAAPGGTWDAADNGAYAVQVNAGQVRDPAGNVNGVANGSFAVSVTDGGGGGPGPDLVGAIAPTPALPPAVIGGQRGTARVILTNQGDAPVQGPVGVQLLASTDAVVDANDAPIDTVTRNVRLQPGRSRPFPIRFTYPNVVDGNYFILANIDPGGGVQEGNEGNNVAASAAPVTIAEPFVDLTASIGSPARGSFTIGRRNSIPITVQNLGNIPASGLLQIDLFASPDAARSIDDLPLATVTRNVRIRQGRSRVIRVNFDWPSAVTAGSYFVTATINGANAIAERELGNNDAVSPTPFTAA